MYNYVLQKFTTNKNSTFLSNKPPKTIQLSKTI